MDPADPGADPADPADLADPAAGPGTLDAEVASGPVPPWDAEPHDGLRPARIVRPPLTLLRGGRADAPAPFVVAPPALQRLDRVVTPDEIDLLRCRRLRRTVS